MPSYFDRRAMEDLSGPFVAWPLLLCPNCHAASLEPGDMQTINSLVTEYSGEYDDEDADADVTPLSGYFHGELSCPRTSCRNQYVVAGSWTSDSSVEPANEDGLAKYFYVTYIFPPLVLMEFPKDVPDTVRDLVASASLVLLSDPSAGANRIRAAIEALLDTQGIHKFQAGSRSKRLTTHARIEEFKARDVPEEFKARNVQAANNLMAMKWIGNIGSHERRPLALSVVLDGIEHFARALELIYDARERALDRRAAQINRQRGRVRPASVARR